jgi:hypothetical protein
MKIPQLVDFADDAFIAAHCFTYAGLATIDGHRAARVDFEPTRSVTGPDVRGSLYLDTLSYQIVRSTMNLELPSAVKAGDIWNVQVATWFREVLPSLPAIDHICQRTTARPADGAGITRGANAATEVQRLLALQFANGPPADFVWGGPAPAIATCPTAP